MPYDTPLTAGLCSCLQVRVLLSSGGVFEHAQPAEQQAGTTAAGGGWHYVGGETRLVAVQRTSRWTARICCMSHVGWVRIM